MSVNVTAKRVFLGATCIVLTQGWMALTPALAQTGSTPAANPAPAAPETEVVVVTARAPIMGSQRIAIAIQRNADMRPLRPSMAVWKPILPQN